MDRPTIRPSALGQTVSNHDPEPNMFESDASESCTLGESTMQTIHESREALPALTPAASGEPPPPSKLCVLCKTMMIGMRLMS